VGENGPAALKGPQCLVLLAGTVVCLHHQPPGALATWIVTQDLPGMGQCLLRAAQGQVARCQGSFQLQKVLAQQLPHGVGPIFVGILG